MTCCGSPAYAAPGKLFAELICGCKVNETETALSTLTTSPCTSMFSISRWQLRNTCSVNNSSLSCYESVIAISQQVHSQHDSLSTWRARAAREKKGIMKNGIVARAIATDNKGGARMRGRKKNHNLRCFSFSLQNKNGAWKNRVKCLKQDTCADNSPDYCWFLPCLASLLVHLL